MPISSSGGERLKRFYVEYSTRSDTTDVKRLQAELVKLQGQTKRTEGKFERLGRRAGRLGNVMLGLSGALAGSAIGFGKLASRTDKFRQQMIGLVGLSPEVAGQFKAAGATIAATFGRDIDEVQSAFYSVTSAGYRSREALDIVERSAQGATAGLGTVAEVSKLLTLSLSVFKQDGLEAGDAMDKLAAGARQANFDGNALGAVLPQLGIFAKGLGVDFGETTGLMAAMSKQIGNAGEAATALQSLFRGLAAPSAQGRKALRDMGIEVQELHDLISEEGLIAGVEFLDQSIRDAVGSGAAYGETLQKVLARIESQTAFRALTSDVEGFSQIVAEVTGASGTLAESLDPVKMGTAEVMNQFKTLGSMVGEVLLPTIDRLGRRLADVQKWMAENADTVQGLAGFVFKVGIPALGGLGVALKGVSIAARIATAGMRAF
ncbi:MAG: phage tail tape measure protein, partial [Gemmatimonadota bacterium]|nr:phage tail tape measure protein [Gemmatimonadota bacterium]